MNCKTCNQVFGYTLCMSCSNQFISCGCKTNICLDCREIFNSDPVPARHRFCIAFFALLDCTEHMQDDNLSNNEDVARQGLRMLINETIRWRNSMKLEVKIKEEKIGGNIYGWNLLLKHGGSHFSGLPIYTADEMREIAKALLDKANEIDKDEMKLETNNDR